MVFCAVFICIVGNFVVVPYADKGLYLVSLLQLLVRAVLTIACTVVFQLQDLSGWFVLSL